jgi:SAM-dependent methyltransferase
MSTIKLGLASPLPVSERAERKLNLGCGHDIRSGWVNLDKANLPGVNVVHDLQKLPLPFADGHFDHIYAKDVLEHLEYIPLLAELHRVLRTGGTLTIQVPHFTSASNFIDPTHVKRFSILTFEFFLTHSPFARNYYFDFSFRAITERRITFLGGVLFYNALIGPLVNAHYKIQKYYELTALSRLFPASNIVVTLLK